MIPAPAPVRSNSPVISQTGPHADRLAYSDEDRDAIDQFLQQSRAINSFFGRENILAEYEGELQTFFQRKYCILSNSGTSALHTAYFALGLGRGHEVIVPTYTHHATVMPLCELGCAIRFADCSLDTGNIDPACVELLITPRTKAIVVTHQWGHPGDLPRLRAIADRHRIALVEDVSLAVGSRIGGQLAGTFGDAACFSLGSSKMFSGGQGGALLLDKPELYERANLFGHFGQRAQEEVKSPLLRRYADTGWGLNYRMHVLAVAVSQARFRRREHLIASRHERFNRLTDGLGGHPFLAPPQTRDGCCRGQWQGYCVGVTGDVDPLRVGNIYRALLAEGLQLTLGGYQEPLHLRAFFRGRGDALNQGACAIDGWHRYKVGDFPHAENVYSNAFGFPLFLDEPLSLIDQYVKACWKTVRLF